MASREDTFRRLLPAFVSSSASPSPSGDRTQLKTCWDLSRFIGIYWESMGFKGFLLGVGNGLDGNWWGCMTFFLMKGWWFQMVMNGDFMRFHQHLWRFHRDITINSGIFRDDWIIKHAWEIPELNRGLNLV
jgi:hypothetical protein